uniref:Uncharacterized protein n=1 Tax=Rousettus aegyptiacus TaxID=9407 RepID=A0A7J8E8V9_ROUAE|nr:hypothetical protein HJG63_008256 [Rousettus aegyptiacus]
MRQRAATDKGGWHEAPARSQYEQTEVHAVPRERQNSDFHSRGTQSDRETNFTAAAPEAHRHQRPEPATHRKSGALIVRCSPLCHTLAVIFGWGPRRSALIGGCECQPLCMLQLGKHCGKPVTRTLGPVTACDSAVAEGREANFQTTDVCNHPGAPWNHTLSFCSWTCGCFFLHHDGSSRKNLVRSILCSITSSIRTHINSSIEAQWKMYSITDEIDIVNSDLCGTLYVSIY